MDTETRKQIELRIETLMQERERLIAQANSHAGAISALRDVLALADRVSATNGTGPPGDGASLSAMAES